MSPDWSPKAKNAMPIFYKQWNDIDIYIEDMALETKKMFHRILERCYADLYRINKIFPLGDRDSVINACIADISVGGRPKIYIIDGDLDLLLDTNPCGIRCLYVLPVYCIENVIIDEGATIRIIVEEDKHREEDELTNVFNFSEWIRANDHYLTELFIEYALMRKFLPLEKSVGYRISNLLSSDDGCVDPTKVMNRILELSRQMIDIAGSDVYNRERNIIVNRISGLGDRKSLIVASGKDYLLHLLNLRMRSITRIQCTRESLKIRLATYCDISLLSLELRKHLESSYQRH